MADNTPIPFVDPKQVGLWMMVNTFSQKMGLENAYLKKMFPDGKFEPVPFGSQIINMQLPNTQQPTSDDNVNTTPIQVGNSPVTPIVPNTNVTQKPTSSLLSKLAQAAILTLGVAGGSLGLASFLRQPVNQPVTSPDLKEKIIEGILEWEFNPKDGLDLKKDGESNGNNGGFRTTTGSEIAGSTKRLF